MSRVEVLGPRRLLPRALELLQREGVLELRTVERTRPDAEVPAAELGGALARIDALLARLAAGGDPAPADEAPTLDLAAIRARAAAAEAALDEAAARAASLREERAAVERFSALVTALAPLSHDVPASAEPQLHGLVLETDPAALAMLRAEVARLTGGAAELTAKPLPGGRTGVLLVVPRDRSRLVTALLSQRGVEELRLPAGYDARRLVDALLVLAARAAALPGEVARAEEARVAVARRYAPATRADRAALAAALARAEAAARCGETRWAFVASGYAPAERVAALRSAVAAGLGPEGVVIARRPARAEWGDVPVVLRNRAWARPFQRLLGLVPLPRYGSLDPTPWLAVFFPLFMGFVLGDLALGAAGAVAAGVVWRRAPPGSLQRDAAAIALACAVSAAIFGVLFGEALGELGGHAGLRPLVLDRRRALLDFLGLALAAGGLHVATGMVLGVVAAVRAREPREAIGRGARLVLLAAGAAALGAHAGALPLPVRAPALGACGAALAAAVWADGPLAALDLLLGFGNVLSYARLMALGLASVMLAEVANLLGAEVRPAPAGIALAVLLHGVNFTLGLLSPAIAALRLHYVEFFEKFYEAGGREFRPFALAARYERRTTWRR